MYGGLLFVGVFFSALFLTATVLIIYFKQISEAMDDREQYILLQKVGMDEQEVSATINRQVMLVFFLPLITALIHTSFAADADAVSGAETDKSDLHLCLRQRMRCDLHDLLSDFLPHDFADYQERSGVLSSLLKDFKLLHLVNSGNPLKFRIR